MITDKLMMAFGGTIGLMCALNAHSYYQENNELMMWYSIGISALIIFMYFCNYHFINSASDSRLNLYIAKYRFEQHLNVIKMEVEIAMRRNGVDVPDEMLAHIPALDDLDDKGLFVCGDPNCG